MSEEMTPTRTRLPSFHPGRPKWAVKARREAEYLAQRKLGPDPDLYIEKK